MSEAVPEPDGLNGEGDCRAGPDPDLYHHIQHVSLAKSQYSKCTRIGLVTTHQVWICRRRNQHLTQSTRQSIHEEENSHDQPSHIRRRPCIGHLIRGDITETFRHGSQDGVWDLPPNTDGRDARSHGACGSVVSARTEFVDAVLDDGADDAGDGGEGEAEGDAGDAPEFDIVPCQEWVDDVAEDRDEDDDGQRVEVVEEVVGRSVGDHCRALVAGDGADAAVVKVPDGEEAKDLTLVERGIKACKSVRSQLIDRDRMTYSVDRAVDVIDELVIPSDGDALSSKSRRFRHVPETLLPDTELIAP